MKKDFIHSRKFRHGSLSVALTVLIIAAVVLVNVIASALSARYSWMYLDMTSEKLYTLSKDCINLLEKSFVDIMKKRQELNADLPTTNFGIAEDNVSTAEKNVSVAAAAVATAEKNVTIAEANKKAFDQNVIKARSNAGIADSNLELAKELVKIAAEKAGRTEGQVVPESERTEEEKCAAAALALAQKNKETADKNLVLAAKNEAIALENAENDAYNKKNELKPGDTGYRPQKNTTPLTVYETFADNERIQALFGVAMTAQTEFENVAVAERNLALARQNLALAQDNVTVAESNKSTAEKNKTAGVIKGDNGYTELSAYHKLFDYESYKTIPNFTEPNAYHSILKTATFNEEKGLYETDVKIDIIFCDLPDNLNANESQRLVHESAKDLAERFPNYIRLQYIDIWTNATAVQKYKTTSMSTINSTNVIISSGSEFRICTLRAFFVFNSTSDSTPWAYRGEQTFAANILAVSQAESPIACVTINHAETFTDYELLATLQMAGYKVQTIDLAYQDIPDDCRLVVVYNPKEDFMVKDGISEISEIEKLDKYLDTLSCSMMVFINPETPRLPNLEEYLEEWGVSVNRFTDALGDSYNYTIKESSGASLSNDGFTFSGSYVAKGAGASIYKSLTESAYPPKIVFKNSGALSYSDLYEKKFFINEEDKDDKTDEYWYGYYYSNGVSRRIYDVFTSTSGAVAMANGSEVARAGEDLFKLMTITRESRQIDNTNTDYATVMVCASTDFATEPMLSSAVYGNNDVILAAARGMGKEFIPVDLELKPFASTKISEMSTQDKNRDTALLAIVPAAVVIGLGIFVLVRRKYS